MLKNRVLYDVCANNVMRRKIIVIVIVSQFGVIIPNPIKHIAV